jgi:membrane protease YdiL (CAAX protease family)
VLFSLYHFFTPWQNPERILGLLPLMVVVWWRRNLYIGMTVHCLGNIVATLALLPLVLR